jgi:hypothetical protein
MSTRKLLKSYHQPDCACEGEGREKLGGKRKTEMEAALATSKTFA